MKRSGFYLIEVAPLSVLPLSRPMLYSYRSTTNIPAGSWVRIPFGKGERMIDGVVYRSAKTTTPAPVWMKPIASVEEKAFLTPLQLELAEAVSREYFAPLGKTLRHFLPPRAKARGKKKIKVPGLDALKATATEAEFLTAVKKIKPGTEAAYNSGTFPDHKKLLALLAQAVTKKDAQMLILLPEIALFPGYLSAFTRYFPEGSIVFLHSKLPKGVYFETWERIRTGEVHIIFATRQGLFAPFLRLETIVITEEEDESYKQWDMSPRYEAKRVARLLSNSHGARLLFSSVTPSLETVYAGRLGALKELTPLLSAKPLQTAIRLVNLKLERFQKNYSPLSASLKEVIRTHVAEKKPVLLYVERQGTSAFSICSGCKNIFRCPRCSRALASTTEGYFQCPACRYRTALFPGCPACRNLTFRHIGYGTKRLEREVQKAFPQARIARADGESLQSAKAIVALYEKGKAGEIDVLIGTQMILNDPPLPPLGLTAIIDADSLLSRPDYRADERYFHLLIRAAAQSDCRQDSVLVQTFHPESTLNQRVVALSPEAIYESMLGEREATGYPPYTRALLVTCQDPKEARVKKDFTAVQEKIEKIIKNVGGTLTVLTEAPKYLKKERVYLAALALRVPDGDLLPPALVSLLRDLSPVCRVDVDPLSLYV